MPTRVTFGMFDSSRSVPPIEAASNSNYHISASNSSSALGSFVRQSLSSQGGTISNNMIDLAPLSPVSSTSALLLGIHNYKALDDVNLPDFVKEHQATLTFPEKVRNKTVWDVLPFCQVDTLTCDAYPALAHAHVGLCRQGEQNNWWRPRKTLCLVDS